MDSKWQSYIDSQMKESYFTRLREFVQKERSAGQVYPSAKDIFSAFLYTPYDDVKVVIIGQDPYHTPGHAHGMAFSSLASQTPPSLFNIFKEIREDFFGTRATIYKQNNLWQWATQGVLLLNTVLTVRKGEPRSHAGKGWEIFTRGIIKLLNDHKYPIVYLLWGSHAKEYSEFIDNKHYILEATHPSPYSANNGFFGSKPFSQCNSFLNTISAQDPYRRVGINWGVWEDEWAKKQYRYRLNKILNK